MQEKSPDTHPLSDLAYDWLTLMQNKAQALMAYDQYIKDARLGEWSDWFADVVGLLAAATFIAWQRRGEAA